MGSNSSIVDILRVQAFGSLPPASQDKQLAFVEDDGVIYYFNQQGGGAGHLGTNWFVVGSVTPFGYMIFVTPGTNNKATDAATFGVDWPNGDESFTIQDGIAAAEALGGGTVWGIGTGFVINNPARNNQILMRPNVQVKFSSIGARVRTRDTGVDSAEPQGGIVMFSHPDYWDGVIGTVSLTLDPAGKPGDGTEDGMYVSRLELNAGEVAAQSVVVGGLIMYANRTRRISSIVSDTVFFDRPVPISDVAGAPGFADYLHPNYVIYNSGIDDFSLYIEANGWITSYYGIFAGYGSYWCEVGEVEYIGQEIDTAVPANSNIPIEGGFITAYNCYDWRIRDIRTKEYPFMAWYALNCDAFEFVGPRFDVSPAPAGFSGGHPTHCFKSLTCDEWKLDGVAISVVVSAATAGNQIGLVQGTGLEKILVLPNCTFSQAGYDAGAPVVFTGIGFTSMSNVDVTADIIAGNDPAVASTVNTVIFDTVLKAHLSGRLRAAGHLAKSVPATVRSVSAFIKSDHTTILENLAYCEGADEVGIGSPDAPLYLLLSGCVLKALDVNFRRVTLDKVAGPTPKVYMAGHKLPEGNGARSQYLFVKTSFYGSLTELFAEDMIVSPESMPCTLEGRYLRCRTLWEGAAGGVLTLNLDQMRETTIDAGAGLDDVIFAAGVFSDVECDTSSVETHISGGALFRCTLGDFAGASGGYAEESTLTLLQGLGTLIPLNGFRMRGGVIGGGGVGVEPILDMESNSEVREAQITGTFDATIGGAARTGVYFMQNRLDGAGTITVPLAATTKTWVKDNKIGTNVWNDLSVLAQTGGNV